MSTSNTYIDVFLVSVPPKDLGLLQLLQLGSGSSSGRHRVKERHLVLREEIMISGTYLETLQLALTITGQCSGCKRGLVSLCFLSGARSLNGAAEQGVCYPSLFLISVMDQGVKVKNVLSTERKQNKKLYFVSESVQKVNIITSGSLRVHL